MTVTTATFKVDGRHSTNLARSMVLDGDWRDGLNLLTEGFEGLTYDIAFLLLKGTHTLVGINNDISMIEEVNAEYQEEVREMYCHDKFYEMGELYSFVSFIDHTVIDQDITRRGLTYAIPASDEYVRKYLMPHDEDVEVFEATPFGKHYRGLFAKKLDRNTLPLWMTKADFCTSAKAYANKYHPAPVVKRLEPSEVVVRVPSVKAVPLAETAPASNKNDWHDGWRAQLAEQKAKDHGFDNVVAFSNHLRVAVIDAIKERNGTWKTLTVKEPEVETTISFPYELALAYSLSKTGLRHLAPEWQTVSPGCLKMENDSRLHTDFWLSLGFNLDGLEYNYDTPEYNIFAAVVRKMQREVFPMGEFDTLNSANLDSFSGSVVTSKSDMINKFNILVIPHAGPEFDVIARKAGLVICETGSRMAHLAVVGREFGLPLIRIEGACSKFKEGITLNIDFTTNTITASS